jgi:hypothetical protein
MRLRLRVALSSAGIGLCAACSAAWSAERAVIHFADLGGIENWRPAEDGDAILIEGRNGNWYRATFLGVCPEVHFETAIAFVTDVTGDLDRFGSIIADGRRCYFETFERTSPPESE